MGHIQTIFDLRIDLNYRLANHIKNALWYVITLIY
jgi:hypothetical protein